MDIPQGFFIYKIFSIKSTVVFRSSHVLSVLGKFCNFKIKNVMKRKVLKLFALISTTLLAQNQGDIAFVGYNGDGDDDFAIVALADIPENSTIYFTDGEPNPDGNGIIDDSEGVITWSTGSSVINAGTVVVFTDTSNDTNPMYGASVGTIVRSETGFLLSVSTAAGDNIFATLGNPSTNEITTWLAGVEFRQTGQGSNFGQTGLTVGINYLVIDNTQSKDGGQYTGLRVGKTVGEYRSLIHDEEEWTTNTSDGEAVLPFSTTSFNFSTLSVPENTVEKLVLFVHQQKIETNIGVVVGVCNVLGQQVKNQNLEKGVYVVSVKIGNNISTYKLAI